MTELKGDLVASYSARLFCDARISANKGGSTPAPNRSRAKADRIALAARELAAAVKDASGARVSVVPVARITDYAGRICNGAIVTAGNGRR